MKSDPIRILTVDDHQVLRDGIAALISNEPDMEIVGEAENGLEAIETARNLRPDVILMDLRMPQMDGIDAIKEILAEVPGTRIIVLTTYAGDAQATRALKAGARAYLLKSSLRKELLDAIRLVCAGKRYVPADIAQEIAIHSAEETLSTREVSILELVGAGKANKVIAWELSVSEDTVKAHLRSIFSKLDVTDRTQAVTVALRRGIIAL
jgi:DNA-binding NarL/FixJ family response regulator